MHSINIPTMTSMISHIAVGMCEPCMFWGQPGAGKTEGIMAAVEQHDGILVDVRLGQYDSVDLRGIPVPDEARGQTVWYAPITLPFKGNPVYDNAEMGGRLIFLFLDEIAQCQPSVFGVAMQLVNERRIGEHELLDNVRIVAAGNRDGDRAATNRMPTTVANRFTHAEIVTDVDAWCHWATKKGLPSVGVAFMQFRKNLLSTFDPAKPDKAFATPRTWEKALRYFAKDSIPTDIKQAAMTGAVGEGPANEFWGFVDIWHKMIPMSKIEADPEGCELPKEAAMRYAVSVAVSGTMTKKNTKPFNTYLMRMDPEFSILAWQLAISRDIELTGTNEFVTFSKKYREVLQR